MFQNPVLNRRWNQFVDGLATPAARANTRRAWSFYLGLFHGNYGLLTGAVLSAIAQSLALLPVPVAIGYMVDRALASHSVVLVLLSAVGIFAALLAYASFGFLTRHFALNANSIAVRRLRNELLTQCFRFSRAYLTRTDNAKLHAHIVQDSERVATMGTVLIEQFAPAILTCIPLCGFLLWLDWRVVPVLVAILPVVLWSFRIWERRLTKSFASFRTASTEFSSGVLWVLRSFDLVRHQAADEYALAEQKQNADQLHQSTINLARTNSAYVSAQSVIIAVTMLVVLVLSGLAVVKGRMTLGQLLALYAGFALLRDRLYTALQSIPHLVSGNESLLAMWQMLQVTDHQPHSGARVVDFRKSITFREVTFGYDARDVIKDVSLGITPGVSTAIIGPNAAGKTTLIHLLLGLYRPRAGEIEVDGHPIAEIDLQHLRRQIGVVAQDPLIPSDTIASVINYGFPEATVNAIRDAAEIAGLSNFIDNLPQGYDSETGEGGTLLSGGQRQRLALARALVRQPKLLILDEPTNHLDPAAVADLISSLRQMSFNPAILLITHDYQTAMLADYVYVIADGCIVAQGAKVEVLQNQHWTEMFFNLHRNGGSNPAGVFDAAIAERLSWPAPPVIGAPLGDLKDASR